MMRFARWSWLSPRPRPAGPRPAAKRRGLPRRPAPAPLDVDPRPLILSRKGIVVSWAPKSACSHVAIWFFLKEGLLPAANYYHPWPHNFRVEVYYRSLTYKRLAARLAASEGRGHTLLRIVRDPERRMVSIFRHVCRHPVLRKDIDRKLGIDTERDGLSLRQFDAFLAGETPVVPSRLNMHLCAQHHPTWAMPFDRVVTINMDEVALNPALNAFEADVGIERTDFARLPKLADIATRHYAREAGYDGDGAIEDHRFRAADTDAFPKAALEASPLVREMARRHHGIDFTATRSGDSMDRLRFGAAAEPPLTADPGGRRRA